MPEPTPEWAKKQNLTTDLYDMVKPLIGLAVQSNNDGLIRAVAKEVIQAGYRKSAKYNGAKNVDLSLSYNLLQIIRPLVSVWIQKNRAEELREVITQVVNVGYRQADKKAK